MEYGFVVDTDKYSGNFEREMCAYMTGHIGECEVGDKEAKKYLEKYSLIEGIISKPDDHGCRRPVVIYETSNMWNNGFGFSFKNGEEEIALQKYKEDTKRYFEGYIKQIDSYRGKNISSWTNEAINKEIQNCNEKINKALSLTKPNEYPAYQSILIYFDSKPTENVINFLKERAYNYAQNNDISIIGFRLVEFLEKTVKI
jgi:hypothetical protein